VKIKHSNPQKAHPWRKARLLSVDWWQFTRWWDLQASGRTQKRKKKEKWHPK